jgi:hypothetical protein
MRFLRKRFTTSSQESKAEINMSDSGFGEKFAGPYQRVFTSFGATADLRDDVAEAPNLPSGAMVIVGAAGAGNLVWIDDSGTTNTLALTNSQVLDLPFAIRSLGICTITGQVVVYWHGGTADYSTRLLLGAVRPPQN